MARRSVMFTPGDQPEFMREATETAADVVIFDLEDTVAPSAKATAREQVNALLTDPGFAPDCEIWVRVSSRPATMVEDIDTALAGDPAVDGVVLPMAESAADPENLTAALTDAGHDLPVIPLVETARGVLNAEDVAAADAVDALILGGEDFTADVGANRTAEGTELQFARQRTVVAASAADVDAIDVLNADFEDEEQLRRDTESALDLGFDGKLCIHIGQIDVVNEAFTPSEERIEWAEKILAARDEAEGKGFFEVDGEIVDTPIIARAEQVLDRARAAGAIGE